MDSKKFLLKILKSYQDTNSLQFWKVYYDFISYSYEDNNRHGLSSLSIILKSYNIKNEKQLLEIYARGLLIIARKEGEIIYGSRGFNI
ncbi:hypothetical protein [Phocicoccus pinnipedialis]|uniref:hypothetical protein n=1 Tax=Phocicoccus pinnipedialis TaxID=110845 RepID=UPI001AE2EE2F|nr:hypothetical protein [Jeotgalicoccus pinnipedialis]MBP1939861.1 hypothetical protein [Jeotgalicoccus pinnipedialis]